MSGQKRLQVTERDIQAYVDGQIEPGTEYAEAVEACLAANPGARARVRAYAAQDAAIRARYQAVLAQPVPERLAPEALRTARRQAGDRRISPLRFSAGVACLCCAVAAGWLIGQPPRGTLERFADRTSAYLAEQDDPESSRETETLRSLSILGGTPDFSGAGLDLVSARRVGHANMYEARYTDAAGRELRLFMAPDPQRHDDLLTRTRQDGRKVVYWKQGPFMYALTGDFSERDLNELAVTAIARFREKLDGNRFARSGNDTNEASTAKSSGGDPEASSEETGPLHTRQSRIESESNGNAPGDSQSLLMLD